MTRPRLLLAGYAGLAAADIAATALGAAGARRVTKPALMTALVAYTGARRPPRGRRRAALLAALGFSLGGDTALLGHDERSFPLGLGLFLGAQVSYLALFSSIRRDRPSRGLLRRHPTLGLPLTGYWAAMNVVLRDGIGPMRLPVAAYSGLLLAMAAAALDLVGRVDPAAAAKIATGAGLFVASDSILAGQAFGGLAGRRAADVTVMATYVLAQALLVDGALDVLTSPVLASPPPAAG